VPSYRMMAAAVFADPPVLCGHRGSGRGVVEGHRENTVASFRTAVEAGFRWVEVDARANADGVLVAHHDPQLEGAGWVSELPTSETDAAGLMRVADLFEDLPPSVAVDVDVKSSLEDALRPRGETTAALVASLLGRVAGDRRLLVSSFDAAAILTVRELLPGVPIGLLTWSRFPLRKAIAAAAQLGADVVAPHASSFFLLEPMPNERPPAESVRVAHQAGLQVLVWNSQPEEVDGLFAAGIDCLVVDNVLSWT
jgi:glycerophosphoryl diester phosphodiesterase